MALIPQNATGTVADANTYVTLAEFKAYHALRGNTVNASDPLNETAIVRALDYIDTRFNFIGERLTATQTTSWPRKSSNGTTFLLFDVFAGGFLFDPTGAQIINLQDSDGNDIIGIPDAVKRAQHEYALRALNAALFQDAPAAVGGREVASESVKVDVIEQSKTYVQGQPGAFSIPVFPQADMWLQRAGLIRLGRQLTR